MPDKDIFAKTEDYLNQQKELYDDEILSESMSNMNKLNKKKKSMPPTEITKKTRVEILEKPKDIFTKSPKWLMSNTLEDFYDCIHSCKNCDLGKTRNKLVFGTGNPNADIMIIGEAPGADEDEQGKPFVGRAGQLLTKILLAIDLSRDDVFIANIIKCRPPSNRRPKDTEVSECKPYLDKQIELIKPEFIVTLGATAIDSLMGTKHKMGDIRGKILDYHGIKLLVTFHPAYLLRKPSAKKEVWEDMKKLRSMYKEYKGK